MSRIETDYLIIGTGAVGLAFADELLAHSDATITMIDRHGKPGGHWNDAYSFVALHQPSQFYGVNGMELGSGRIDDFGFNKGHYELASGPEVSAYFDKVMQHRLLPSGRVRYFPMSEFAWPQAGASQASFTSLLSGETHDIAWSHRLVDATYYGTTVPSTHKPKFSVAGGARLVPPNALPMLWQQPEHRPDHYTIIGAGKTAMDAIIWLVESGVPPQQISWVCPRSSWLINRACTQPGMAFFDQVIGGQAALMGALADAQDATALFAQLEDAGYMLRIHPDIEPAMFHYATISQTEVDVLRRIDDVIRMGHVTALAPGRLILQDGERTVPDNGLFIDCTATAVTRRPMRPIFEEGRITLQMIRIPQPAFSAALCAYIETLFDDDATRNNHGWPVALPDRPDQYPAACLTNMINQRAWGANADISKWLVNSRLDGFSATVAAVPPDDSAKIKLLMRLRGNAQRAAMNIPRLIAQAKPAV